jgi:hypothetical protein
MLNYLVLTLLLGIATNRIVEVWWHSALMQTPRLYFKYGFIKFPFSDALLCPYCISHWVAAALTAGITFGLELNLWLTPLLWLGAVFTANLANDLVTWKTPRVNYTEDIELAKTEDNA